MRRIVLVALTLTVAIFSSLILFSSFVVGAQSPLPPGTSGYVSYRVTFTHNNGTVNFVVNETVQPANGNGMVKISLLLVGSGMRADYSRVLNASSLPLAPYLLGLNNQSFSYSIPGWEIGAHVLRTGTINVSFDGKPFQGANYGVSIAVTNSSDPQTSHYLEGNIVTMPSGLIYMIELQSTSQVSLTVRLLATNLPLAIAEQSASNAVFGYALVGLGLLGAIAIAVPSAFAVVRVKIGRPRANTPSSNIEEHREPSKIDKHDKPEYWVD